MYFPFGHGVDGCQRLFWGLEEELVELFGGSGSDFKDVVAEGFDDFGDDLDHVAVAEVKLHRLITGLRG
jgi:hypothetical protein